MKVRDMNFALRLCDRDPAKEARLAREQSQHAFINGNWGAAQLHLDCAVEWERFYEECRKAGVRLQGESAGRVAVA